MLKSHSCNQKSKNFCNKAFTLNTAFIGKFRPKNFQPNILYCDKTVSNTINLKKGAFASYSVKWVITLQKYQ